MEHILFLFTIFLSFAFSTRCNDVYTYSKKDFPEGFVFGSAVSAYQVRILNGPYKKFDYLKLL